MALFTVQPETCWLCDDAAVPVSAMALERDKRTVKQVRIPVHGAGINLSTGISQPVPVTGATCNGAPRRFLHNAPKRTTVGVQPTPGPGRCVQQRRGCQAGVQPQPSRPRRRHPAAVSGRCVTAALAQWRIFACVAQTIVLEGHARISGFRSFPCLASDGRGRVRA